ncbi:MAG: PilZ domain-containing protein [Deltaproteobacteria bacterium]|nr:PilZ domain-containing protein [Deltaproteobacteria bacterium]
MPNFSDKRAVTRFDLKLPANITLTGPEDQKTINISTTNICSGGAFFYTEKPFDTGTKVKIDIILPIEKLKKLTGRQALIKVSGKVIRSGAKGMAICFDGDYQMTSFGG